MADSCEASSDDTASLDSAGGGPAYTSVQLLTGSQFRRIHRLPPETPAQAQPPAPSSEPLRKKASDQPKSRRGKVSRAASVYGRPSDKGLAKKQPKQGAEDVLVLYRQEKKKNAELSAEVAKLRKKVQEVQMCQQQADKRHKEMFSTLQRGTESRKVRALLDELARADSKIAAMKSTFQIKEGELNAALAKLAELGKKRTSSQPSPAEPQEEVPPVETEDTESKKDKKDDKDSKEPAGEEEGEGYATALWTLDKERESWQSLELVEKNRRLRRSARELKREVEESAMAEKTTAKAAGLLGVLVRVTRRRLQQVLAERDAVVARAAEQEALWVKGREESEESLRRAVEEYTKEKEAMRGRIHELQQQLETNVPTPEPRIEFSKPESQYLHELEDKDAMVGSLERQVKDLEEELAEAEKQARCAGQEAQVRTAAMFGRDVRERDETIAELQRKISALEGEANTAFSRQLQHQRAAEEVSKEADRLLERALEEKERIQEELAAERDKYKQKAEKLQGELAEERKSVRTLQQRLARAGALREKERQQGRLKVSGNEDEEEEDDDDEAIFNIDSDGAEDL